MAEREAELRVLLADAGAALDLLLSTDEPTAEDVAVCEAVLERIERAGLVERRAP